MNGHEPHCRRPSNQNIGWLDKREQVYAPRQWQNSEENKPTNVQKRTKIIGHRTRRVCDGAGGVGGVGTSARANSSNASRREHTKIIYLANFVLWAGARRVSNTPKKKGAEQQQQQ